MIYFLALIPATMLTIAGYFVLFLSARSEGALRAFGRYLGFWAFTLAGLVILGAIFAAAHHGHRAGFMREHGPMHWGPPFPRPYEHHGGPAFGPEAPPAPPASQPETGAPSAPSGASPTTPPKN